MTTVLCWLVYLRPIFFNWEYLPAFCGLNYVPLPSTYILNSQTLITQNVIVFGDRDLQRGNNGKTFLGGTLT